MYKYLTVSIRKTMVFILLCLFTLPAFPQTIYHGKVMESIPFYSKIMGKYMKYTVYLPPDYNTSNRRYPVVYLLHGGGGDDMDWLQFGEANRIADQAISKGEIPAMILIMPYGGLTWYVNDYKGEKPWADMFVKEFIPYIDSIYHTRPDKKFRAIAGLSMGGYGALQTAMRNTDMFVACVALSSGVFTDEQLIKMDNKIYDSFLGLTFGEGLKGKERITPTWKDFSPLYLLNSQSLNKLKSVRWYLDIGDDDFLYKGNSTLHIKMREMRLPHEYRVRDGNHNWTYWRTGLENGLKFIGKSFHQ